MVKTLTQVLEKKKATQKGIFIPYIMAGDHEKGVEGLQETISDLNDLGVTAIEVGIPFSDPVADGPVIELAGIRSIKNGTTPHNVVLALKNISSAAPLIIMTYFNTLYQYGLKQLVSDLKGTAVKGLIIPDLPHEQEYFIKPFLEGSDIALIPLVSLTTGLERQKVLVDGAEGFIYAVAVNGVTGNGSRYRDDLDKHLKALTDLTQIPVVTGFGVSSLDDVKRFNKVSDGVIVGSKIVKALHEGKKADISQFIKEAVQVTK